MKKYIVLVADLIFRIGNMDYITKKDDVIELLKFPTQSLVL